MTVDGLVHRCEECGLGYDPDDVFEQFLLALDGVVHEGPRPRWISRFCSWECRYLGDRRRIARFTERSRQNRHAARAKRKTDNEHHEIEPHDGGS